MPITGRYRIVEMDLWDQEDLDLIEPAFIELDQSATGAFCFIAVEGSMDCRAARRDGRPAVEFSWEGDDDGTPSSGRGWAVLEKDHTLRGHFYFHLGDASGFRAIPGDDL
jgi:hypothetical protein